MSEQTPLYVLAKIGKKKVLAENTQRTRSSLQMAWAWMRQEKSVAHVRCRPCAWRMHLITELITGCGAAPLNANVEEFSDYVANKIRFLCNKGCATAVW